MPIVKEIQGLHEDMTAWRHELHAHPETAFEEVKTSEFVANKLAEFGIEVSRGLAKTGVVGTLSNGEGGSIAPSLNDIPALPADFITGRVRGGYNAMPPFSEADLSNAQLAVLIDYAQQNIISTALPVLPAEAMTRAAEPATKATLIHQCQITPARRAMVRLYPRGPAASTFMAWRRRPGHRARGCGATRAPGRRSGWR